MEKEQALAELRDKCMACRLCSIGGCEINGKPATVFSNMNAAGKIMVVGQNPGADEVDQGTPFIGRSGHNFDVALKEVLGIDRSFLYISNCVRCYTQGNRSPLVAEIRSCRPLLDEEIAIVDPVVIVTLGGPALSQVTGLSGIMKCHGEKVISPRYGKYVLPFLHPSPLNMNVPAKKKIFYDDLAALKEFL